MKVREIVVRYKTPKKAPEAIHQPSEAVPFLRSILPDNSREHFLALYLDGKHAPISYAVLTTGTANSSQISPREIFQRACIMGAVSLIIAHNHPSGSTMPSDEDIAVTQTIKKAGNILSIKLLDHLILTDNNFLSLQESNLI
jgi:DNA repair protein RadC